MGELSSISSNLWRVVRIVYGKTVCNLHEGRAVQALNDRFDNDDVSLRYFQPPVQSVDRSIPDAFGRQRTLVAIWLRDDLNKFVRE